jgi:putative transposase
MPNHVHLVLTPADEDGLRRALARVHRAYAGTIHARQKRTGHFWQGRFGAVAMDEDHLLSAVRYVGLNPVRAGLVKQAEDWAWSSARAHLTGEPDGVTDLGPMKDRLPSMTGLFDLLDADVAAFDTLRKAESIGRPVGNEAFLDRIAGQTGKAVKPEKRGRRLNKNSALSP